MLHGVYTAETDVDEISVSVGGLGCGEELDEGSGFGSGVDYEVAIVEEEVGIAEEGHS